MAHTHSVIDDDLRFIIDPSTREIGNGSQKVKLMQYDHNSEQFTFEIPRFVEGHDMSLCNSIRVNYININKSTREQHPGVYEVSYTKVEGDNIIFSWLVSRNATQYVGPLNFLIKFMCFDENDYITYEWHTDIFKSASVSTGMNNEESIEEVYPDILEKWKNDVLAEEASRITAESERVTAESERVTAESERAAAESERVTAESERVTAESERANTFAGYETEINQFKNEIVTGKDSATDNTKFAIGKAEPNLEVPTMEEFNQLADDMTGKLSEPAEGLAVGKYFRVAALDENGHAVLEAVDAKDVGVQDVQVSGESIVMDGVANVPVGTNQSVGVVRAYTTFGTQIMDSGILSLVDVTTSNIDNRDNGYRAISSKKIDYAVKAAMCDGKGAAWTADEQAAARERMGIPKNYELLFSGEVDNVMAFTIECNKKIDRLLIIVKCTYADVSGGSLGLYCMKNNVEVMAPSTMEGASSDGVQTAFEFYNDFGIKRAISYRYNGGTSNWWNSVNLNQVGYSDSCEKNDWVGDIDTIKIVHNNSKTFSANVSVYVCEVRA